MSDEPTEPVNPFQAPVADSIYQSVELSESDAEFSIPASFNNQRFTLRGHSDRLQLIDDTGKTLDIPRSDPLFVKLLEGTLIRNTFRVKLDRTYLLKLQPEDFATLKRWIGPPTIQDLKEAVGGKSWWQLIVVTVFLISIPGSPAGEAAYDGLVAALLIIHWTLARFKPNRWLFLLLSALFLVFASFNGSRIYTAFRSQQSLSWLNIVFLVICLNVSWHSIQQFRAYRVLRDGA